MTNYEKVMNEMTPEKLADMIDHGTASCLMCTYRNKSNCSFHCRDGIEEWLNQEADND